jgi:hypothetical protein
LVKTEECNLFETPVQNVETPVQKVENWSNDLMIGQKNKKNCE